MHIFSMRVYAQPATRTGSVDFRSGELPRYVTSLLGL